MIFYNQKLNKIFRDNRNAKTEADRVKVIGNHKDLLRLLRERSDQVDQVTKTEGYNPYHKALDRLTTWILSGSSSHKKDYKSKLKNENPSDYKDNLATQARTYRGKSNYYTAPKIQSTKSDLKDPYVKQLIGTLYDIRHHDKGNWITLSHEIHDVKSALYERLKSLHGVNHQGRTDNEPTPLPREQKKNVEDIKDPYVKLLASGYDEKDIHKKLGMSVATVSRHLHSLIK